MKPGKFAARMIALEFGFNGGSGNHYAAISFQIIGGAHDGEIVQTWRAKTPKTLPSICKLFKACGWSGKGIATIAGCQKIVLVDVRQASDYKGADGQNRPGGYEVAFVNELSRVKERASRDEVLEFFAELEAFGGDVGDGADDGGAYTDDQAPDAAPPIAEAQTGARSQLVGGASIGGAL